VQAAPFAYLQDNPRVSWILYREKKVGIKRVNINNSTELPGFD
jgi:hypothetical protein